MTPRKHPARNNSQRSWQQSLFVQSVTCISGVSLLSSSFAFAQTEPATDTVVPTIANQKSSGEGAAIVVPETSNRTVATPERQNPDFSTRRSRLKQRLRRSGAAAAPETAQRPERSPSADTSPITKIRRSRYQAETPPTQTPSRRQRYRLEISTPEAPVERERDTASVELSKPIVEKLPKPGRVAVPSVSDRQNPDINIGVKPTSRTPNWAGSWNRQRGCGTLANGQALGSGFCAPSPTPERSQPVVSNTNSKPLRSQAPSWLRQSQTLPSAGLTPPVTINRPALTAALSRRLAANRVAAVPAQPNIYRHRDRTDSTHESHGYSGGYRGGIIGAFGLNSYAGFYTLPKSRAVGELPTPTISGNLTPRPSQVPYNVTLAATPGSFGQIGNNLATISPNIIFPLSMPAPITSLFGWRIHPISGGQRFHSGTDIGAPMGTPVVAAYSGQVEVADFVGGYGLTVVLNHGNMQQTLYGHLSDLFVQPGQFVPQGTVIGRVGSTGNSTGPHLHFEVRQLTGEGWVAVDPGMQVESALGMLMQTLQTTQLSQQPTDVEPSQPSAQQANNQSHS